MIKYINWLLYYFNNHRQIINGFIPEKILIIRNDHLGDVCVSLPFINAVKTIWKNCETHILINRYTLDLVSGNSNIDNIILQEKNEDVNAVVAKINENYDVIFNLCSTKFNAELSKKISAKYKIGYAYKFYNISAFNRYLFMHRKNPPVHESVFCLNFLKIFNINFSEYEQKKIIKNAKIYIDEESAKIADAYKIKMRLETDKKIVAIHPGDNKSAFNLKLGKYIELAEKLIDNFEIVFIFGPAEKHLVNKENFTDVQLKKFKFINGDLSVKQLAGFMRYIYCLVSASTGPMHIAGLMNIKTVSIFSNKPSHSYLKWHPLNNEYSIIEPEISYKKLNAENFSAAIDIDKIKNFISR